MSFVRLVPPGDDHSTVTANALTDLLWPHVAPGDGVQHLYARGAAGGIELAAFCLATEQAAADVTAYVVCLRAMDRIPLLRGWQAVPIDH